MRRLLAHLLTSLARRFVAWAKQANEPRPKTGAHP
jgi:hypothetical protein